MNWITYVFAGILILFAVSLLFGDFFLKYVFKDGRTSEHKRLRVGILVINLFVIILNQGYVIYNVRKNDAVSKKNADQLRTLESNQVITISNQTVLSHKHDLLLAELATNTALDLNKRMAIAKANEE